MLTIYSWCRTVWSWCNMLVCDANISRGRSTRWKLVTLPALYASLFVPTSFRTYVWTLFVFVYWNKWTNPHQKICLLCFCSNSDNSAGIFQLRYVLVEWRKLAPVVFSKCCKMNFCHSCNQNSSSWFVDAGRNSVTLWEVHSVWLWNIVLHFYCQCFMWEIPKSV